MVTLMARGIRLWWCLAVVPGCFDAIIDPPGATEGAPTTTGASEATTTTTSVTGSSTTQVGTTAVSESTTDEDLTTTMETTGTDGQDGPICAEATPACGDAPWELMTCQDPCLPPPEVGLCALGALRDRVCGAFVIDRCAPGCERVHYAIRCGGDEVVVQRTLLDRQGDPVEHLPPLACDLADPTFFQGCLDAYGSACSDPAAWVSGCEPFVGEACPL